MPRFILVLGPPGSGKSTIIALAKDAGYQAIDLEKSGTGQNGRRDRFHAAEKLVENSQTDGQIIVGMADVDPAVFPKNSIKILLLPSLHIYKDRLQERDVRLPHKAGQDGLRVYQEFFKKSPQFDYTIQNDSTPEDALNRILTIGKL